MNDILANLIEALRDELQEYGEMLALLDQQQAMVIQRQAGELTQSVASVNTQLEHITAARLAREQFQRRVAMELKQPEDAPFKTILPLLPADYQPLVDALVKENNDLLARVQQRTRQNHVLLSHAVEMMQQLINTMCPGQALATYDGAGRRPAASYPRSSIYEDIG